MSTETKEDKKIPKDIPQPSQWFTTQYLVYYVIAIVGYAYVTYVSIRMGDEYGARTPKLYTGWFFGRKIDKSDAQWFIIRQNFPVLMVGSAIFIVVSNFVRKQFRQQMANISPSVIFYNICSLIFVYYVHGNDIIWLYALSTINYAIAKNFKSSRWNPALTWIFNLSMLFYADYSRGFKGFFTSLGLSFLEKNKGLFAWNTYFKLTILRHISFNMDYYWMCNNKPVGQVSDRSAYTQAQENHLPAHRYSFWPYLAYCYYIPLFIAGPIVTFNAWVSQVEKPQQTLTKRQIFVMLIKVVIYTICLDIWLHFFYHYSFNVYKLWKTQNFSPLEVCLTGYWTLNFMYTKFLIIWRFFRVVSLFDGIDTPENMNRCVNNNFTFTGFWRSWHGSLNRWIIRYLYVPLGGSKTQALSMWLIFTFIGLWHDLITRWLAWAWCNCVFFTIEILIIKLFGYSAQFAWLRRLPYWRNIIAAAGVLNIYLLMAANLAILHGFADTPIFFQRAFLENGGWIVFIFGSVWLYTGVMFMLEIRESEKRQEKAKKF